MKQLVVWLALILGMLGTDLIAHPGSAVPGQFLVQTASTAEAEAVLKICPQGTRSKILSSRMHIFLLQIPDPAMEDLVFADLLRHPAVLQVQENHHVDIRDVEATLPNDAQFASQWALNNTGQTGGLADADMDAPEAWDLSTGQVSVFGDSLVVAIIDDGFDLNHEDLRIFTNLNEIPGNGIDDDGNGYIDDYRGWNASSQSGVVSVQAHGTHVAGISGAITDNGTGVSGVAWGPAILPVQVETLLESEVVQAYDFVLNQRILYDQSGGAMGAYVVSTNASFGVNFADPAQYPIWCAIYDSLGHHGILSAVATMNIGQNVDVVNDVPSGCTSPWLIAVTNTTASDVRSAGAAFGPVSIDLGAPGTGILSTLPNDAYGLQTGTSMASPQVAGAILVLHAGTPPALYAQYLADPAGTSLLFKQFLMNGVDSLPSLTGSTVSGGRLNLFGALQEMITYSDTLSDDCLPAYQLSASAITDSSVRITWNAGDSAQSFVVRYRPVQDSVWADSVQTTTDTLLLTGLSRCQAYQIEVKVVCSSDTVDYLATLQFRTEGCCEPPAIRTAVSPNDSTINFGWNSVFGANAYELRVREQSGPLVFAGSISDTLFVLTGLEACVRYEWQIASACDTLSLLFSDWMPVRTLGCGTCQDSVYCLSRSSNTEFEWLESLTIGSLQVVTGNNDGYVFRETPFIQLAKDSTLSLVLNPGYQQFSFDEWWRIWIDLNQDGILTDSTERVFDSGGGEIGTVNGTITIPSTAMTGPTRMRVSMKFPGFVGPSGPNPCENFEGGEVEDYCVLIVDSLIQDCGTPVIKELVYQPLTQELTVLADSVASATSYEMVLTGPGFPVAGLIVPLSEPGGTFVLALGDCEEYTVELRTLCGNILGGSDLKTFTTPGCGNCLDLPYCVPTGLTAASVWVEAYQFNALQLQTGNDGGYLFLAGQSIPLTTETTLTGWVLPGAMSGVDSVSVTGWVDVNGDGFWDSEETFVSGKVAAGDSLSVNWPVPDTISLDGGRIRLLASLDPVTGSCENPVEGEVEELCFEGRLTSVETSLSDLELLIFPNPFYDILTIQSDQSVQWVALYDLNGREIARGIRQDKQTWKLRTDHCPPGVYWISVGTSSGVTWRKVLKSE